VLGWALPGADYDNDGFLDLYVANSNGQNNYLYRNNGDGTMTQITSGPPVTKRRQLARVRLDRL
jgi:hypothetical protein